MRRVSSTPPWAQGVHTSALDPAPLTEPGTLCWASPISCFIKQAGNNKLGQKEFSCTFLQLLPRETREKLAIKNKASSFHEHLKSTPAQTVDTLCSAARSQFWMPTGFESWGNFSVTILFWGSQTVTESGPQWFLPTDSTVPATALVQPHGIR
jgi:hypothetical protein